MKWLGYLLELAGIGAAIGGLFLVAVWLGLLFTGLTLIFVGVAVGGSK